MIIEDNFKVNQILNENDLVIFINSNETFSGVDYFTETEDDHEDENEKEKESEN